MKFFDLDKKYIEKATDLVIKKYLKQIKVIPILPTDFNYEEILNKSIKNLFENGKGIIALKNSEMVGFIAGYENENFFGKHKGIYIPIFGHAAISDNKTEIYQKMYQNVANIFVGNEQVSHAISVFTYDKELLDIFFWLGFGLRCVDSIREVSPICEKDKLVDIRKVDRDSIDSLIDIHKNHNLYYRSSPIFMPNPDIKNPIEDLGKWFESENHHMWAAFYKNTPIGYMRLEPEGMCFISDYKKSMHITNTYVEDVYRELKVGKQLLNEIMIWLRNNDYSLCSVDFESINTIGSNFWNKFFIPHTFSLTRRIDERILSL